MKKIWISILLIAALLLSSCANIEAESTTDSSVETTATVETTVKVQETTTEESEEQQTMIDTTQTATVETMSESTSNIMKELEETTTWATGTTYDTLPEFEGFMEFGGEGRGTFWQGKADIASKNFSDCYGAIFRIIGVKNPNYGDVCTLYYAQVIKVYGAESFDPSVIYCLAYKGTYENTLYGRPPLEIGKDYLYIIGNDFMDIQGYEINEYMPLVQMGLMMPVVQDGDKTYVYGYGVDFSGLQCAIEITDDEENHIYKVGKHDAIIAKLNGIGMRLPTFDYKCELEEMLKELDIIK